MVHGANLEPVFVSSEETRLPTLVTRSSSPHHRSLRENTRSTIWVRSVLGVNRWECDRILVILSQVEVTRKPTLDTTVFTNEFNEFTAFLVVRVIEPAATIYDV